MPFRERLKANYRVGHHLTVRRIHRAFHPKNRKRIEDILIDFKQNFTKQRL
jgi:hypothetical protein